MLSAYPSNQMGSFHPGQQLTFEQRVARQENWFRNLSGMEDIDKLFFQLHWIPVQDDLAQWFIDLSNPDLPVFSTYFFELDPKGWHRNPIMHSLSDLILAVENGISRLNLVRMESHGQLDIFFKENHRRTEMKFSGEIKTSPVTIEEAFIDGEITQPFTTSEGGDFFLFNTHPLAIGIFQPETKIWLNSVKCELQSDEIADELERITMIRHFIHFLRQYGQENFPEFQLNLIDSDVVIWYNVKKELIVMQLTEIERSVLIRSLSDLK